MSKLYDQTQRSVGNASEGANAARIKNKILSDFYHHGYKVNNYHNDLYDEPTYLTFRIAFNFDNPSGLSNYNDMPMPLFKIADVNSDYAIPTIYANYSTYDYLMNQKENLRAKYLVEFAKKLKDIQDNYPFYFKSVEGIGNLLKVNSTTGRRLKDGENILTIKCLEGLDLKIDELLNLYRKIAWDDVYQRWVLPDMMRYFQMKIYISEIRNFHTTSDAPSQTMKINGLTNSIPKNGILEQIVNQSKVVDTVKEIVNSVKSTIDSFKKKTIAAEFELINQEFNNYMPTLCITCNQCEFMIDDSMSHFGTFNSVNRAALDDVPIKIKVGNIMETQYYPLDSNDMRNVDAHVALIDEQLYRPTANPWSSKDNELKYLVGNANERNYFINEEKDKYVVYSDTTVGGILNSVVAEMAVKLAQSAVKAVDNKINNVIDILMNKRIGNSNVTVQGMMNALASKNIITMYSYMRDSINQQVNASTEIKTIKNPYVKEKDSISNVHSEVGDNTFKAVLNEISKLDISKLPKSAATENKNAIVVAKIISDSSMNTIDLDYFFDMFKDIDINRQDSIKKMVELVEEGRINKISMKVGEEYEKNNEISSFKDQQDEYNALPDSEAVENLYKTNDILKVSAEVREKTDKIDGFSEQQDEYNSLPDSEAVENMYSTNDIFKVDAPENTKSDKIDGFSDQKEEYEDLPDSEAVENLFKTNDILDIDYEDVEKTNKINNVGEIGSAYDHNTTIVNSEFNNLIAALRKLSLSTATDSALRVESLSLYNMLKQYIDDNNSATVKSVLTEVLSEDLPEDERKAIIEMLQISSTESDLESLIKMMKETKNSIIINDLIHENIDNYSDQKEEYENLPDSEAVENMFSTNEMTRIKEPSTHKNEDISGFSAQQEEYNSLPDSEAVENRYKTNEMTTVESSINPKTDYIDGYSLQKEEYEDLPTSEAVENRYKTNEMTYNEVEVPDKKDFIKGFEGVKKYMENLSGSEATENKYDELNPSSRSKISNEYSKLKK